MLVRQPTLDAIAFGDLRIFDYTANADLASSLALIEVPPGASHAESYSLRSDKYYLVIEGELHFALEDEAFELARGDFCLVSQGRRFSYRNHSSDPAKLVLVHTPSFDLASEVFPE